VTAPAALCTTNRWLHSSFGACAVRWMMIVRDGDDDVLRGGRRPLYSSHKNLHAMIAVIAHCNPPVSIDNNTVGTEFAVAAAAEADASNMRAITVPQHLHANITVIGYKDVPRPVKGNAKGI